MLILAALLMILMVGMIAFAMDIGYVVLVRSQLQTAADSAAMAAAAVMGNEPGMAVKTARQYAAYHTAGGESVQLSDSDVELGIWDTETRSFVPLNQAANAVRVTARRDAGSGGEAPLFFARIFGHESFSMSASAVATANPRDIVFVVDLSGSMNDDTEPAWATGEVDKTFGPLGYAGVGAALMQDVYDDFGFGGYPGPALYVGESLGVTKDQYAYAELTKNGGPLAQPTIPVQYRISSADNELTRKKKAYSWMIDYQIAAVMPNAQPTPNSATTYGYWEKYLDYILWPVSIMSKVKAGGGAGPAPGTPPSIRGSLPASQNGDRIIGFNNPNTSMYAGASSSVPASYRNWIGYLTYTQFMMDHGRDLQPVPGVYVPLSRSSPYCPYHAEATAGGTFSFPPREQPIHATRRALIAALQVMKERNGGLANQNQRDWAGVISFDAVANGSVATLRFSLSGDYDAAMLACTKIQPVGDKGNSTATESGLDLALKHLQPIATGGGARVDTSKDVIVLSDGAPNVADSPLGEIEQFIQNVADPSDFYSSGAAPLNAALAKVAELKANKIHVFPVGVGAGADYDFMDRAARIGGTADAAGQSPRGSGNPADYELRLKKTFEDIITHPQVRLVQ
jgi:Putative Tad-like Flp pilus-assembly